MRAVLVALALGLTAAPALAQEATSTGSETDSAQSQTPAEGQSDSDTPAEPAELAIDQPFGAAWLGAADADVTLVVFADYGCDACRNAQPALDQLLAQDPKVRIVYRLIDNDQGGRTASLTSLAVARKGANWGQFHRALDAAGEPNAKAIAAALAACGIAPASLPRINEDNPDGFAMEDELSHNDNLMNQRKGTGIPAWVIGDSPATVGVDLDQLKAAVAAARAAKAAKKP